ncbi:MAG: hypothetical protein R3281_11935, partial [Balneolaceae bacterium]|nr:hypothetical protein [Balneolaceae bacterium]
MSDLHRKAFLKKLSLLVGAAGVASWGSEKMKPEAADGLPFSTSRNVSSVDTRTIYLWDEDSKNNGSNPEYRPKITIYTPSLRGDEQPQKAAVLVCPGGGYHGQAPHEGEPFARLFALHGMVSAVLTYRVHPDRFPGPYA